MHLISCSLPAGRTTTDEDSYVYEIFSGPEGTDNSGKGHTVSSGKRRSDTSGKDRVLRSFVVCFVYIFSD
jgi:hypothetical protein